MSITEPPKRIQAGFERHLGIQITYREEGHVVVELPITSELLNAGNLLHGGVIASLLDHVMGLTIRSQTEYSLVTVNLNIHYLASAKEGDLVVGTAKIRHIGKSLATGEGEVRNSTGKLLAIASATFKLLSTNLNEVKK
ncbi:PaaI family thioesterase [Brevibacillus porteri]|uniref:PaaI family thioesterase n=1 Tax=Brevibacillus porteri TaxID=2126350 RepID=UPI003D1985DC